ncbi:3-deoxy-7-phosphoheptulonate synthase [Salinicoccus sediminis]|uniref:3-deoxy-7-phosphoheptulonate synthase n=1 Tax=Salinicoccus sediminis TaxID=1432562 RepID=A0A0M2SS44_9STAP|nr:bifunctional 3-deoxy-7-phosphoheptulonate synthase/chorismate mutase [Salinicoccus sediminis]KKK35802.1 3-deoxy-7-phosphoheptulonate synthase [Salinicoccus sediminis]
MTVSREDELFEIDMELLKLLDERIQKGAIARHDVDEAAYIQKLTSIYDGAAPGELVEKLIQSLFNESGKGRDHGAERRMLYSRESKRSDTIVEVNGHEIGGPGTVNIFGPCAVESYRQTAEVAAMLKEKGLGIIRGGAYKPRTSPYDFQGLGEEGLRILSRIREEYGLAVISEITAPGHVELARPHLDIFQIGARNMQNFELLKAVGRSQTPVLLKRGLSATVEEFLYAAEYILAEGNPRVILCERGIRTYEKSTRNTLDISAVPLLKQATHLPVMVDVTHSTGRKEIMAECAKAALAAGADGIMAEVHPEPDAALSDSKQQMSFTEFEDFYTNLP